MSDLAVTLTVEQLGTVIRQATARAIDRFRCRRDVLDVAEAAAFLGWDEATVVRLLSDALLPCRYLDARSPRFFRTELEAWVSVPDNRLLGPGVYALRSGDFFKVGKATRRIRDRIQSLQTGSPHDLELLAVLSSNPHDEHEAHAHLRAWRVRGEWFALNPESRAAVASFGTRHS